MIEDLKTSNMTVVQFLDELRDNKGHTSIIFLPGEDDLINRNFTFFYDGDLLEYQVGTKRLVKAIVDGDRFAIRKDGKEYRGEKARASSRPTRSSSSGSGQWTTNRTQSSRKPSPRYMPISSARPAHGRSSRCQRVYVRHDTGTHGLCAFLRVRGGPCPLYAS